MQADTIVPGAGNPQALNRYSYSLNSPTNYTDPSGHRPCDGPDENGQCITLPGWKKGPVTPPWTGYPGDPPYSVGYDPTSKSIPDWGKDQSQPWRIIRAQTVWGWVCSSGGPWGEGCPTPQYLAAWTYAEEMGILNNQPFVNANPGSTSFNGRQVNKIDLAKQIVVGTANYYFADGDISSEDLSNYTSFFNPNSGEAFDSGDWQELTTAPPQYAIDAANEYWSQGPVYVGNSPVIYFWFTGESWCAGCISVDDLTDPSTNVTYYFGYKP